jgi:hypothetical protein
MTNPDDLITDFKTWYDAVWLGDKEHGQFIPNTHDLDYLEYLNGYTLAHGAWQAALSTIPAARSSDKGEAVACRTCGETEPFTGTCGTSDIDTKALCKAAPQQEIPAEIAKITIPTIAMEQEFQKHYKKGFEDGKNLSAAPTAPIDNGVRTCDWEGGYDDSMPSTYKGTCGIVWSFIEDGLAENDCKFCPRCGGKITDITVHLESDE